MGGYKSRRRVLDEYGPEDPPPEHFEYCDHCGDPTEIWDEHRHCPRCALPDGFIYCILCGEATPEKVIGREGCCPICEEISEEIEEGVHGC